MSTSTKSFRRLLLSSLALMLTQSSLATAKTPRQRFNFLTGQYAAAPPEHVHHRSQVTLELKDVNVFLHDVEIAGESVTLHGDIPDVLKKAILGEQEATRPEQAPRLTEKRGGVRKTPQRFSGCAAGFFPCALSVHLERHSGRGPL